MSLGKNCFYILNVAGNKTAVLTKELEIRPSWEVLCSRAGVEIRDQTKLRLRGTLKQNMSLGKNCFYILNVAGNKKAVLTCKSKGTLQQSWNGNQRSDKVEGYFEADELSFESCWQQKSRVEPRIISRVIYVPLQAVRCVICGENPKECSLFYGIWIPIVDRNDSLKTHIQIKTHTQRIKF